MSIRRSASLRNQLLGWMLPPLFLLWMVSAVSAVQGVRAAATQAHDRTLLASARSIAEEVDLRDGRVRVDVPWVALDTFQLDTPGRIFYVVTGIDGEFVSGFDDFPPLPPEAVRSPHYPALVYFRDDLYRGNPIRVAALYQPVLSDEQRGVTLIQVGETLEARSALTGTLLTSMLVRQSLLVFAGGLLIVVAVYAALAPLRRLRHEVVSRAGTSDPTPFETANVPREVKPLVSALNDYTARLHALHAGQKRFIADAAHQLRTPLTVLRTQAEHGLSSDNPELWRESLEGVRRSTDDMVRLTNQLLTLARAEARSATLLAEPAAVDVVAMVREICLDMAPRAVAKGIDLGLEADGTDAGVAGDPTLLHEAFANLVDNALRYTPQGGRVTVRIHCPSAARVQVEVEDNGPGIPESLRERVFERFYRVPEHRGEGSGLGLAIVRDVIEIHGGTIALHAADGQGLIVRAVMTRLTGPDDPFAAAAH